MYPPSIKQFISVFIKVSYDSQSDFCFKQAKLCSYAGLIQYWSNNKQTNQKNPFCLAHVTFLKVNMLFLWNDENTSLGTLSQIFLWILLVEAKGHLMTYWENYLETTCFLHPSSFMLLHISCYHCQIFGLSAF